MYSTIFEYFYNDSEMVLVKASCTDVSNWAINLKLDWPKDFKPTRQVADEIEEMAVAKLLEEKNKQ